MDENDLADNHNIDPDSDDMLTQPSEILARHCEENGRKYHGFKDGKYVLPTDEEELQRQGQPNTSTICVSLPSARMPSLPSGICTECLMWAVAAIDDLEEPWTFSFKYDYIHVSMMTGAFRDWSNFYYQAFHFLKSEGWVEIQDIDFPLQCADGSLPSDSAMRRWSDLMLEASRKSGYLLDTCGKAAELMREAGFVDIVRVPYKWPIGPWPRDPSLKQLGAWVFENFHGGIETMSLALFTRFLGWSLDEVRAFAEEARAELCNRNFHTYFDMYVTYGRKP
ncbi:sam domain protein [Grosmannia clavigera kw1407]|uniref:Sam domain protein n=1 Tax=Grosmannia clavigera (strain kw1407 / UAMH 11150) TaxID=655863 RepID=F0XFI6_GROCL|nr:sam domain protein [Grosmannia clavigera kw1407]EFX03519.1 sam domain protein [Grosmannia clavigera kw1407]